jgi:hypothetical protein
VKTLAFLAVAGVLGLGTLAEAADRPVVVELFTSQGCNSCPPAEAFLVDLTDERSDVLALAFHVDYWDRLGWKDAFSSPAWTARQRQYSAELGLRNVYTPQIVVDGRREAVGSDRASVLAMIRSASQEAQNSVPVELKSAGEMLSVTIGAGEGTATAWLVGTTHDKRLPSPAARMPEKLSCRPMSSDH